jgi:hypothetical protein
MNACQISQYFDDMTSFRDILMEKVISQKLSFCQNFAITAQDSMSMRVFDTENSSPQIIGVKIKGYGQILANFMRMAKTLFFEQF